MATNKWTQFGQSQSEPVKHKGHGSGLVRMLKAFCFDFLKGQKMKTSASQETALRKIAKVMAGKHLEKFHQRILLHDNAAAHFSQHVKLSESHDLAPSSVLFPNLTKSSKSTHFSLDSKLKKRHTDKVKCFESPVLLRVD